MSATGRGVSWSGPQRQPPPAERWKAWRAVLEQVRAQVDWIVDTGGADGPGWPPELLRGLHDVRRVAFPIDGASGPKASGAFFLLVEALIDAALPARRVALAEGVAGAIRALEGLVHAEQARLTEVWKQRLGAGG